METQRTYATGKRKSAIARVWIEKGGGDFRVNNRSLDDYFHRETSRMIIKQPLDLTRTGGKFNVMVKVKGGGISAQAGAIKHGISKALVISNPDFRKKLKGAGFLTRDSRTVERKKYGQKKARKRFQFSKR